MQLEKFTELIYFEKKFSLLEKWLNKRLINMWVDIIEYNIIETKFYRNEGFPYIASQSCTCRVHDGNTWIFIPNDFDIMTNG